MQHALVVEDMAPARDWLTQALALSFPGISVSHAACVAEARQQLASALPDIALVDLGLPDGSGIEVVEALTHCSPSTLCIIVTVFDDDKHLFRALRAGAQGYLLKDHPPEELSQALLGIAQGSPPLSAPIARRLLDHFRPHTTSTPLTPREEEVLVLIAKGYTLARVGETLGISPHTAGGYVKELYSKLNISSRAEAALEAARRHIVTFD